MAYVGHDADDRAPLRMVVVSTDTPSKRIAIGKIYFGKSLVDDDRFFCFGLVIVVEVAPRDQWNVHCSKILWCDRPPFCQLIFVVCETIYPDEAYTLGVTEGEVSDCARRAHARKSSDLADKLLEKRTTLLRLAIPRVELDVYGDGAGRESCLDRCDIDATANQQTSTSEKYHDQRCFQHDQDALRAAVRAGHVPAAAAGEDHTRT